MAQAHIVQALVATMGGKSVKLDKFLLIKRQKAAKNPHAIERELRAALEG